MKFNISLLFAFFAILFSHNSFAQSIAWGTTTGSDLDVLYSNSTVTYKFTNVGTALTNATLEVQLGTGIEYLAGNLIFSSSGSAVVTETSVTGDNLATFNIGTIAINEIIEITFTRQASCAARAHKISSGSFSDVASVFESGTEVTYLNNSGNPYDIDYDVTYANIVLSAPSHSPSSSTSVGATVTRSVNITNGSFGSIDNFWYQDDYDQLNLSLDSFKINGTLIDPSKIDDTGGIITIEFDPSNIIEINGTSGTIGDADPIFEKDEFFTLSYNAKLLQCGSGSYISDLDAFYGIDVNTPCDPSGSNSTSLSITNGTPSVSLSGVSNPNIDLCDSTTHIVRLTNSGTDPEDFAKDVVIFIGLRSNGSPIATLANVSMWSTAYRGTKHFSNFTLNGNPVTPDSITGVHSNEVDYIPHNYFQSDPDGIGIGLEDLDGDGFFDDLGPGQSVDLGFNVNITPEDHSCSSGRADYLNWEHISVDAEWRNQCGVNQSPDRQEISYRNIIRNYNQSTFLNGPTDINDGDLFEVGINPHLYNTVNCNGGSGLTGADVNWTVKCILPAGVSLQTGATTDAHHAGYNPTIWQSNDTVYYNINRYNRNWYTFPLELDCALWDNSKPMAFEFVTTYECGSCWEENIHCETFYVVPHCPESCIGIVTTDFDAQRTTAGWTDDTKSTHVVLTPGTHGTDKILPFDTIQMISKGYIADTTSDNLHLRIEYTPEVGDNILNFVNGEITIFDIDGAYGSTSYSFPISTPTIDTITNVGADSYYWNFNFSSLLSNIDANYNLGEGIQEDSFIVNINAVNNSNPGGGVYKINSFRSNFYMIDGNSQENSCDSYGTQISYTGFSTNVSGSVAGLPGCNATALYNYMSWISLSGDIFPNEYRPIQQLDSIVLTLPAGVKFTGMTGKNNFSGTVSHHINSNGDIVAYPSGTYAPEDWRSTHYPRIDVFVKPDCSLTSGIHYSNLKVYRTLYNYHPNSAVHEQHFSEELAEPVINYIQPIINATPLNQVQNGILDSVEWEIEVCNATSGLDVSYNWLTLDNSASHGITVRRVLDANGLEIVTSDFGGGKIFVPIGNIDGGDCSNITVVADYNSCTTDDLIIENGWDCDAYPTNASELPSCSTPTFVRVIPLNASIAAAITNLALTPSDPSAPAAGNFGSNMITMCDQFPVEYRIISSSNASLYDINFDVLIPNAGAGLTYVPNSATIEVEGVDILNMPRSVDAAAEAALVAGTSGIFNISLADLDATNFGSGQGLVGAGTDPTKNEIIVRFLMQSNCTFTSGRRLKIQTFGRSFCESVASGNGEIVNSSSLEVNGSTVPYIATFNSSLSPNSTFNGCNDTKTLSVDLNIIGGPTSTSDTLFVTLYEGLEYNGIFNCTSTSCPVFEGTRMENGNQIVLFSYPAGVSDELMSIDFEIGTDDNNLCSNVTYELTSVAESAGLFCSATGTTCPLTTIVTGSTSGIVTLVNAQLEVAFNSLIKTQGTPNQFDFDITVSNVGASTTENPITVSFYEYDIVNDSITGPALGSITTSGVLAGTSSEQLTDNFWTLNEANDGIVAVVNRDTPGNCSCPDAVGMDDNPTATSSFVLPVEISFFRGEANGCTTELTWQSNLEINNAYFRLDHSEDGTNFKPIALIESQGNGNSSQTYNHRHENLLENQNYYRLMQADYNGNAKFLPTILVNADCRNEIDLTVFPNPIGKDSGPLTIKYFSANRDIEIEIIDLYGNIIQRFELQRNSGYNTSEIEVGELPSGTYFIREQEGKMVKRFVILE